MICSATCEALEGGNPDFISSARDVGCCMRVEAEAVLTTGTSCEVLERSSSTGSVRIIELLAGQHHLAVNTMYSPPFEVSRRAITD
jgi:hypothetical protein